MVKHAEMTSPRQPRREKLPLEVVLSRGVVLGITPSRALFLTSCPHGTKTTWNTDRHPVVTTDEQIAEAARIGLTIQDASVMLNLSVEFLEATGYAFAKASEVRLLTTSSVHTLMAVVEARGNRFRKRKAGNE
jgi:hypothetical protein